MSDDPEKLRRKWTGPEKWQVMLAALALLVGLLALAGQFAQLR